jgi:hypothetical protein
MIESALREFVAPIMAHCMLFGIVVGLLIAPLLVWFARVPYPLLFTTISKKAANQPKGSGLRQLAALMPFILMALGISVCYSFPVLLRWYSRAPSVFRMDMRLRLAMGAYFVAFLLSFGASVWWIGGLQAFRPAGYDPKNPNPDPDEWRWQNRN